MSVLRVRTAASAIAHSVHRQAMGVNCCRVADDGPDDASNNGGGRCETLETSSFALLAGGMARNRPEKVDRNKVHCDSA